MQKVKSQMIIAELKERLDHEVAVRVAVTAHRDQLERELKEVRASRDDLRSALALLSGKKPASIFPLDNQWNDRG